MRWPSLLLQQLLCFWIEQRRSNSTVLLLLRIYTFFNWYVRAPAPSTVVKNILDYSTRNGKFKRLEPHFQLSATRSASKEGTETAVASPHSRECTKEPISALPNFGSKGKFGARAELRNFLQEKLRGRGGSSCRLERKLGKKTVFLWAIQDR